MFDPMRQLLTPAVPYKQASTDQIRQVRAMLEAVVPDDGTTRGTFGTSEEIADLLEWGPCWRTRLLRRAMTS